MRAVAPAARSGFTLIELMIVVAIIGILAGVAIPKFADLLVKSQEGATKGNLGQLRSAINIYYGDMEGYFPNANANSNTTNSTVLSATLLTKYLDRIPQVKIRNHAPTTAVYQHSLAQYHNHDSGRGDWGYDGRLPRTTTWGSVWIWCSHTDSKGTAWSEY